MKAEIPNPKHQIPKKFQIPKFRPGNLLMVSRTDARPLRHVVEFDSWYFFGIWCLGLGIFHHYYFFFAVTMGKSSERKGDAGKSALFHKLTMGKSAQP